MDLGIISDIKNNINNLSINNIIIVVGDQKRDYNAPSYRNPN